jgi:hypothetical protein
MKGEKHANLYGVDFIKESDMSDNYEQKPPRRRGLTSMTLQWIADKLRRADRIKEELSRGTYQVDSAKVAQAIVENGAAHNDNPQR